VLSREAANINFIVFNMPLHTSRATNEQYLTLNKLNISVTHYICVSDNDVERVRLLSVTLQNVKWLLTCAVHLMFYHGMAFIVVSFILLFIDTKSRGDKSIFST
jgi:hypothetical protein